MVGLPEMTMRVGLPFVVTVSVGGPFEDRAFMAGYQMGRVVEGLRAAVEIDATTVRFLRVNRLLLPQIEMDGEAHGYGVADVVGDGGGLFLDITLRRLGASSHE